MIPGAITPPTNSPSALMQSNVVAVPQVHRDGIPAVQPGGGERIHDAVGPHGERLVHGQTDRQVIRRGRNGPTRTRPTAAGAATRTSVASGTTDPITARPVTPGS